MAMLFVPFIKEDYSTLHKKNSIHHAYIVDVPLTPLSFQKFILGICTLQKLTFWTTTSFRKTSLLVLNPFSQKTPSKNLIYMGRGVDIELNGPKPTIVF